jgi:hypothetical protein
MAGKGRKPAVDSERRLGWLRRVEAGEPSTKVAKEETLDIRTVRRHLDMARGEREAAEARSAVLRSALIGHHQAMCDIAAKLRELVRSGKKAEITQPNAAALLRGLREHLRGAPLGKNIDLWNTNLQKLDTLTNQIRTGLAKELAANSQMKSLRPAPELIAAAAEFLTLVANERASEKTDLTVEDAVTVRQASKGKSTMRFGSGGEPTVDSEAAPVVKDILKDFETKVTQWPKYTELEKLRKKVNSVGDVLDDELTTVILRQVIPGRCRYCPV